ncbi:HNH endonuclease signature motif containing protein [Arthrobacter sedimenti]|uniref:HNH endonuclease signature motif containing protein n=1 Tax=Arthrobacter sedimenti TaxID=2694931 RepID=UPI0011235B24|nr:HNH endonuclease signature motif containing protein [Arthrobacter sedimenti]
MAIAPIERSAQTPSPGSSLDSACAALTECAREVGLQGRVLSRPEALQLIIDIEQASRIVDHLQVLAARLAEEHYRVDEPDPGSTSGTASLLARAEQVIRADALTSSTPVPASSDTSSSGAMSDIGGAPSSEPDGATSSISGAGMTSGFRDCADFLRATLGVSRAEARRRLALAELVLPRLTPTGATLPPRLEGLGAATEAALVSGRAATIVSQAVQRVHSFAAVNQLEAMEENLTRQAVESDEDILRVLARRWEGVLDQDGQEPSEKVLRARQGVFLRGRRHGLHVLEIGATDEQFEHLSTVMNAAANPRTQPGRTSAAALADTAESADGTGASGAACGAASSADSSENADTAPNGGGGSGEDSGWGAGSSTGTGEGVGLFDDPGGATRAQMLLEGLVGACRIALSTGGLPATGGHRPQVMVTIDYQDLLGQTQRLAQVLTGRTQLPGQRPGQAVFAGQASARTIRQLACDADIIPVVLGGAGQVLDLGRAQRLFPPHLRRALVARDKGCAFPDCTIPAPWCEAHHIDPWSRGGTTSIGNGALLCSRHHHLIHQGHWKVEPRDGVPWFHAPGHPGRAGTPRTNTYWHTGQVVHHQLLHAEHHDELLHDRLRPAPISPGWNRPEQTEPANPDWDWPEQTEPASPGWNRPEQIEPFSPGWNGPERTEPFSPGWNGPERTEPPNLDWDWPEQARPDHNWP